MLDWGGALSATLETSCAPVEAATMPLLRDIAWKVQETHACSHHQTLLMALVRVGYAPQKQIVGTKRIWLATTPLQRPTWFVAPKIEVKHPWLHYSRIYSRILRQLFAVAGSDVLHMNSMPRLVSNLSQAWGFPAPGGKESLERSGPNVSGIRQGCMESQYLMYM